MNKMPQSVALRDNYYGVSLHNTALVCRRVTTDSTEDYDAAVALGYALRR